MGTSELYIIEDIATEAKLEDWTVAEHPDVFPSYPNFKSILFADDQFVAVDETKIFFSDDGIEWTSKDLPAHSNTEIVVGIAYGNGTYVLGFSSKILYSTDDGTTWLNAEDDPFPAGGDPLFLKFVNDRFIMSTVYPNSGYSTDPAAYYISTSTDGSSWETVSSDGNIKVTDVAYANNTYIAAASDKVLVSSNGFTTNDWSIAELEKGYNQARFIIYDDANDVFITAGDETSGHSSPNGTTWTTVKNVLGYVDKTASFIHADGITIAGCVAFNNFSYSANGTDWIHSTIEGFSDNHANIRIVYGNGTFVALAGSGEIAYTSLGDE